MTNQQPIKPVFKAKIKTSATDTEGWGFATGDELWTGKIDSYDSWKISTGMQRSQPIVYETLQISLDGVEFHSLEFVRAAIDMKKAFSQKISYIGSKSVIDPCPKCGLNQMHLIKDEGKFMCDKSEIMEGGG